MSVSWWVMKIFLILSWFVNFLVSVSESVLVVVWWWHEVGVEVGVLESPPSTQQTWEGVEAVVVNTSLLTMLVHNTTQTWTPHTQTPLQREWNGWIRDKILTLLQPQLRIWLGEVRGQVLEIHIFWTKTQKSQYFNAFRFSFDLLYWLLSS